MASRCALFLLIGGLTSIPWGFAQDVVHPGDMRVRLKTVAAWNPVLNLESESLELTPTDIVPLGDGSGRLLMSTLGGTIRVLDHDGLRDEPLFNHVQSGLQLQQESGATGIAVHPNFAGDAQAFGYGKIYTITTENNAARGGVAIESVDFAFDDEVHQDVIREWDLSEIVGDPNQNSLPSISTVDSREILRVAQPGPFHNIFDLTFDRSVSPDHSDFGQLYITSGDGGNSTSNLSSATTRKLTSQDLSTVYGNVLRINPNPNAHQLVRINENTGSPAYSISPANPFATDDEIESREAATLAEIFAYGLRSPFRINIDSQAGIIAVSDVGEGQREEVSIVESAGNYGWGKFEGTRQDNDFVEILGPSLHTPPVFEYGRDVGRSAIGGTVYRGSDFPELFGKYVFADFGQGSDSGRLFYGSVDPLNEEFGEIFEFDLSLSQPRFPISTDNDDVADTEGSLPDRLFSIGEDANGELLLIGGQDPRTMVNSVEGAFVIRLTRGLGCDVTGEGLCDLDDLNLLVLARNQNRDDRLFDVDWDDVFDGQDIDHWLQQASTENESSYRLGDANLDGSVDFIDFLRLAVEIGNPDSDWIQGNFDGREGTNFADFLLLASNFGAAPVAAVPEPCSTSLVMALVVCSLVRRRTNQPTNADGS